MKINIIALFVCVVMIISGCEHIDRESHESESLEIYNESCRLLQAYTDSVGKAGDTLRLKYLDDTLEERLARLSYDHPPYSDLWLSEAQNDTILFLTVAYRKAFDDRHNLLNGHIVDKVDSISTDSVISTPLMRRRG